MYYSKDKNTRVTLRLNEFQFNFVKANADILGVSPSEFLRMVVNASMAAAQKKRFELKITDKEAEGRENDKANFDDIV